MTNGLQRATAGVVVGESDVRVWGQTSTARLERTFGRQNLKIARLETLAPDEIVVLVHAGWVLDEALVRSLAEQPGAVLADAAGRLVAACLRGDDAPAAAAALEAGRTPAGGGYPAQVMDAVALIGAYNDALRKREPPVLEPLGADNVRSVEKRLFQGSYKGVTDLVTKYVWPTPARIVTRWCAQIGMTPNQVTTLGFVLMLLALWAFWRGEYGWGLVAAWIMTFLDTVDGKLARVTLTSSAWGNVFDHGIDLIHPPFWWVAWVVGLAAVDLPLDHPEPVLWVIVGGYVVQRLIEGVFIRYFKMHIHMWRPFDSFFRLITARRNPNLLLLTLSCLIGRPDMGIIAVAIWTAASLAVHFAQLAQAAMAPRGSLVSWLAR
ncbi:CDP-alcohol phosphatidyltransferase family protein [Phenylobacterium immobile]|uniref:CDP-alcohol phosphatidyltransferase family protein n=1 Tax=Phenylobacterium immobile TaxID=21 RepID=UPI000B113113|nr:CDP-alcohol phosphatidyltransferase family protein [Phenylobacterium immobile]